MISKEELLNRIEKGSIPEVLNYGVELKSTWDEGYGRNICAFANSLELEVGYLVIGIDDKGCPVGKDEGWLKKTEHQVANHISAFLSTTWAATISGHQTSKGHILIIEVKSPGEVVEWDSRPYKLVGGTSTKLMPPDESLALSLKLPGQDYSKHPWAGEVSASLVLDFAKKINNLGSTSLPSDLSSTTPNEILIKLGAHEKKAAEILFGDCVVRIVYYDDAGDVVSQAQKKGAYNLLADEFIGQIQTWTKSKGTVLHGSTASVSEELPYPSKALRETLANAVAHALYERDLGDIIVELHPSRLVVRNNCMLESKTFAKQWFSKQTHSRNKFLMRLLREAGLTDELGSGKIRLFSQMMEHGKREPIIEFYEKGKFGCWAVTLYNEEKNKTSLSLLDNFKSRFQTIDEARIAMALVLWRNRKWSEILEQLDEHYKNMAVTVIKHRDSPVIVVEDAILTKRWVTATLMGQESLAFTQPEEEQIKAVLKKQAFKDSRNGFFSTDEARKLIGLSTSRSEVTQLSNLFRKWRDQKILVQGKKRGEWIFSTPLDKDYQIIMSFIEQTMKSINHAKLK